MTTRLAAFATSPRQEVADWTAWIKAISGSLAGFQFLWLVPLIVFCRQERQSLERVGLVVAAGAACLVQYVLFGPARMDIVRTVTDFALFATIAAPFVLLGKATFRTVDLIVGVGALAVSLGVSSRTPADRTEVGWPTAWFESTADNALALAATHDLPRPTLANPDLGAVSWRKQFNVIDIGRLGSSVIPRMENPGAYLSEFVKPDILEIHDAWSCTVHELFSNRTFLDGTSPARTHQLLPQTAQALPHKSVHG